MSPGKGADLGPETALEPAGAHLAEEDDPLPHAELELVEPDRRVIGYHVHLRSLQWSRNQRRGFLCSPSRSQSMRNL